MVKIVETIAYSVSANSSVEVKKFVGKPAEVFKLTKINFSSSGLAELIDTKEATELMRVRSDFKPGIDYGIDIEIELNPGEELTIEIKDLSGATNSGVVYIEYEKEVRA